MKMTKPIQHILVSITAKSYRYNISGFVEELTQLPENRGFHACGALPTGVRPIETSILTFDCRLWLLPEEQMHPPKPFLLCWPSSLGQQPGLSSHHFQDHWDMLELRLWEERSEWTGVLMKMNLPQRWWLKSDDSESWWQLWNHYKYNYYHNLGKIYKRWTWTVMIFFYFSGPRVSTWTFEPVGDHWRSCAGKIWTCHPLYWSWAATLLVVRWKLQHGIDHQSSVISSNHNRISFTALALLWFSLHFIYPEKPISLISFIQFHSGSEE